MYYMYVYLHDLFYMIIVEILESSSRCDVEVTRRKNNGLSLFSVSAPSIKKCSPNKSMSSF